MATKAEIQNLINTNLSSGSGIEATDHRAVLNQVLNNLYGIKKYDENSLTNTTNTVVTFKEVDLAYKLFITKTGTRVNIDGFIFNQKGVIIPANTVFFTLSNPEYLMDTLIIGQSYVVRDLGFSSTGNLDIIRLELSSQDFKILDPMPISENTRFSITYNTAN